MDFDLDDGQRLLKESVDRLLADHYGFERRESHRASPEGWSRDVWARLAGTGILGLPFEERHGGFAGGPVETMIVMESFGRALVLEPFLATVIVGGGFLRHGASARQQAALIPEIAAGRLTLAFAHGERQSRYDLADVATTARRDGQDWVIDGDKSVVLHGDGAGKLIVTARVAGSQRDRGGVGVFLVDAAAPGVSRRGYPTQDGLRAAEIAFSNVRVEADAVIGAPGDAMPLVERVVDEATAALCAEAVGAMAALHDLTVEYLKTRRQFGVAIGGFQALQHRAVEMLMAVEQARSMAMFATMMIAGDDADERRRAICAARCRSAGRAGSSGSRRSRCTAASA